MLSQEARFRVESFNCSIQLTNSTLEHIPLLRILPTLNLLLKKKNYWSFSLPWEQKSSNRLPVSSPTSPSTTSPVSGADGLQSFTCPWLYRRHPSFKSQPPLAGSRASPSPASWIPLSHHCSLKFFLGAHGLTPVPVIHLLALPSQWKRLILPSKQMSQTN